MSEHSTQNEEVVDYKAAFFGGGEGAWQSQLLPIGSDKYEPFKVLTLAKPENEQQLAEYYRGVSRIAHHPDCRGTYHATDETHFYVIVPAQAYEEQIKPLIHAQQGVPSINTGHIAMNSDDAILEQRVRALLFDNGEQGWKHINDAFEGSYRRVIEASDMQVRAKRYDFHSEVLPLAQRILHEEAGIESVNGFATTANNGVLSLTAKDFGALRDKLDKYKAGSLGSTVTHLARFEERQKQKQFDAALGRT